MTKYFYCLALMVMLSACGEKPSGKSGPAASDDAVQTSKNALVESSKTKPSLRIETFDGATFDLSEHRDKWVVVNFWATWCAPCLKEIPDFNAFAKANANVQFIGLAYEEIERADMEAFLKQHPIDYPFAILDVYNPPKDFETPRGLPMTVVLAPGGEVVKTFLGPVTSADLSAVIAGK
jgi:thiol-disulfide isomerase/thioredoxin